MGKSAIYCLAFAHLMRGIAR